MPSSVTRASMRSSAARWSRAATSPSSGSSARPSTGALSGPPGGASIKMTAILRLFDLLFRLDAGNVPLEQPAVGERFEGVVGAAHPLVVQVDLRHRRQAAARLGSSARAAASATSTTSYARPAASKAFLQRWQCGQPSVP